MPAPSVPGRSFITRRAMLDLIRTAVLGSYGVTGFIDRSAVRRALARLGAPRRGIALSLDDGIAIDLSITVAQGLPIAEVARQVDSAVRYAIRHAIGRDVARLVIHVNGLRVPTGQTGASAPAAPAPPAVAPPGAGAGGNHIDGAGG